MNPDSKSEATLKSKARETTRLAILGAAETLLVERGVRGVRIEDVADRAGVSVGSIYNHVGDRRALIHSLVEAKRRELFRKLDAVLDDAGSEPFEALLTRFVETTYAHFDTHRALFHVVIVEDEGAGAKERARGTRTAIRALSERTERLVAMGAAQGVLEADPSGLLPVFLLGLMRGVLNDSLLHERRTRVVEHAAPTVRFFLAAARQKSATGAARKGA